MSSETTVFGLGLDAWNGLSILFLFFAAVGAVGSLVANRQSIYIQKQDAIYADEAFARYKADAGKAIAEANARAKDAELQTEILKRQTAPRIADRVKFRRILDGGPTGRVEIFFLRDDPECLYVAHDIARLLSSGGWTVISTKAYSASGGNHGVPSMSVLGGQPSGITVISHGPIHVDLGDIVRGVPPSTRTPPNLLYAALAASIGPAGVGAVSGAVDTVPPGVLRVTVAPKGPGD